MVKKGSKKANKKVDAQLVKVEGRKAVRDMRNRAILNQDVSARNAYLRRRNLRRRRLQEVANLRNQTDSQNQEISELKRQLEELTKLVKKKTNRKKQTTGDS